MADPCPVPEMSAKADIYLKENFGFRPKSRPVVAFGVKFKIFNLFGGLGGRVPRVGVRCVETARLFWLLFWSQKSNAPGQKPFAPPQMPFPPARSHPLTHIIPKFSSFTQKYSSFIKNSPIVPVKPLCYNEYT